MRPHTLIAIIITAAIAANLGAMAAVLAFQ